MVFERAADASTVPGGGLRGPCQTSRPVGVVLAGGRSRRLGRDKATLEVGGETLAGRALRRLSPLCSDLAVADAGRGLVPGALSLPDGPGEGPAAGLLGAARAFPARWLLALACDLPGVTTELLARLASPPLPDLAVARSRGGVEPLAAVYGPRALDALAERVAAGRYALHELADLEGFAVRVIEGAALAALGPPEILFANVNTPEDLARWLQTSTSSPGPPPQAGQGQRSRRKP